MDNQEELFVVVNKSDKIIGYSSRYECHHNKNLIHRAVGVIIYNDKGQILLQKRSKNKDLMPGYYTVSASGHVDKGETYKQAALRELNEELGIQTKLTKKRKFLLDMEEETEMDCIFTAHYNGPFYPNKHEVDEIKLIDPLSLKQLLDQLTPFAKASFKHLNLI